MHLHNEFEVAAPLDAVWDYFGDVEAVAACLPGAEIVEDLGEEKYRGLVVSKVGPVSLTFGGVVQITERDRASRKVVIHADGSEAKGKGTAVLDLTATLAPSGRGGTRVKVDQDLQLSGAVATFGRGAVADVMTIMMRSFGDAMEENIGRMQRGEELVGARSVGGIGVGVNAAKLALMRAFGRIFGIRRWYEVAA
ncbi:MAG: SRPBCC family protein [Sporichthyaceae bacterium]